MNERRKYSLITYNLIVNLFFQVISKDIQIKYYRKNKIVNVKFKTPGVFQLLNLQQS